MKDKEYYQCGTCGAFMLAPISYWSCHHCGGHLR